NGNEKLFLSGDNYSFFLKRYEKYMDEFLDTFCYCLMPNHFHLLVRVKSFDQIKLTHRSGLENLTGVSEMEKDMLIAKLISQQFSNFFNSYSKAFNKQQNRRGSLFMRAFKRIKVDGEDYFRRLVHYIHYNPLKAGLSKDFCWPYS